MFDVVSGTYDAYSAPGIVRFKGENLKFNPAHSDEGLFLNDGATETRLAGYVKIEMERLAVLADVNSVAYPDPATVQLAKELGLRTSFVESCCTLAV